LAWLKICQNILKESSFECTSIKIHFKVTNLQIFPPVRFIFEFACALVMVLAIKESAKLSFLRKIFMMSHGPQDQEYIWGEWQENQPIPVPSNIK
jgi:hypothetical protein